MTTITYNVPNITCEHCVHTIQSELSEISGVNQVQAYVDSKTVQISFESPATEEKIKSVLAEIDYPVAAYPIE